MKSIVSLKRKPVKKRSKTPESKLKIRLWTLCREIVRARYRNEDGTWNCFTCGKLIDEAAKAQTGHFIPNSTGGALLRYELRNLRIQDYYCNINLGGNGSEFYRRLVKEIGQSEVDELFRIKNMTVRAGIAFYEELVERYTHILDALQKE